MRKGTFGDWKSVGDGICESRIFCGGGLRIYYLNTPEHIAAYLTRMLDNDDDGMLAAALGDVARSAGMAKVAEQTGIGREALYKALRDGATPRLDTVNKVVKALGMRMVIIKASTPLPGGEVTTTYT